MIVKIVKKLHSQKNYCIERLGTQGSRCSKGGGQDGNGMVTEQKCYLDCILCDIRLVTSFSTSIIFSLNSKCLRKSDGA